MHLYINYIKVEEQRNKKQIVEVVTSTILAALLCTKETSKPFQQRFSSQNKI